MNRAKAPTSPRKKVGSRLVRWSLQILGGFGILSLAGFLYLNQIGLPTWAKDVVLAQLHQRGIELDFRRIRLRLTRGLVAEEVVLSRKTLGPHRWTAPPTPPTPAPSQKAEFRADEVQLKLDWKSLLEFEAPEILALRLDNAQVEWPLEDPDSGEEFVLKVTQVQARLRFLNQELWDLDQLDGNFHGSRFRAAGTLTNATMLKLQRRDDATALGAHWRRKARRLGIWLERASFTQSPILALVFHADMRHPWQSQLDLRLEAGGATTDHGDFENIDLQLQIQAPITSTDPLLFNLRLQSSIARTPWGQFESLSLHAISEHDQKSQWPTQIEGTLVADRLQLDNWTATHIAVEGITRLQSDTETEPHPHRQPFQTLLGQRIVALLLPVVSEETHLWRTEGQIRADHVELSDPRFPSQSMRVLAKLELDHSLDHWTGMNLDLHLAGLDLPMARIGSGRIQIGGHPKPPSSEDFSQAEASLHSTLTSKDISNQPTAPASLLPWGPLETVNMGMTVLLTNITLLPAGAHSMAMDTQADAIPLPTLQTTLEWNSPNLQIHPWTLRLPNNGQVSLQANANLDSREVTASVLAAADVHLFRPWLRPLSKDWLEQYGWPEDRPPQVAGSLRIILPPWDLPSEERMAAFLGQMHAAGSFQGGPFTFRSIPGTQALGVFHYQNRIWRLPHLTAQTQTGEVRLAYEGNELSKDYAFRFTSDIDPLIAAPLLDELDGFEPADQIQFSSTPKIEGKVWGTWKDLDRSGAQLRVRAENFVLRKEPVQSFASELRYTNRNIEFRDVVARADGPIQVDLASYDIDKKLLYLTGARGAVPPDKIARIIGPKTAEALVPFRFPVSPYVELNGTIPIEDHDLADAWFVVDAPRFEWWRVRATNAQGRLNYLGKTLVLTNLTAQVLQGNGGGQLFFDFTDPDQTPFRANFRLTNAELSSLVGELAVQTNRLEGRLSGAVEVTDGITQDVNSWKGFGRANLQDGYLWGLPIFGMFSPLFEAIVPGLGESRFNAGTTTFNFSNQQISTGDMELRSPVMRLDYQGTVDFDGRLDAVMEARLLRDAPLVGPLLNLALSPITKLLEYRVYGTLEKPEMEPRYLPKVLLPILRPIQTLKYLLPSDLPPSSSPPPQGQRLVPQPRPPSQPNR